MDDETRTYTHGPLTDELLAAWIADRPGTRPPAWWEGRPPRLRLGGRGTPCAEVLAYKPYYWNGLPLHWLGPKLWAHYKGRHGELFDFTDPPIFESEAAYLGRLGELTEGERAVLTADDYAPVRLPPEYFPKES